ncbi:MAG: DUF4405 domain-containing protein [Bacteroidetes bacterium]|jgi:quinol-cytochrome oxidoreductase complex cytochrome b subunit|nr:DUF4405 domain-containing protein [Bacteroidota bacterium]
MSKNISEDRKYSPFVNFILHLHPKRIDKRAVAYNRTYGLGGIAALLFVLLFITGMILRFSYIPNIEYAYESVVALQNQSLFGKFIRNLHHLSATLLIVVTFLHLIRVYYSQSIYYKRSRNWIFGLILLFLVVLSDFTGYLLPWDQLSYWAVTVITRIIESIPLVGKALADFIRSGDSVNENTLLNFYNFHTGILPLFLIIIMSYHFWLVRKAGGVALPETEKKETVEVIPHLVVKEKMAALIVIAGLFLMSVFYDAPLLDEANPLKSPNPTKAPWYFLGAQELLFHLHPVFSAFIIPVSLGFYFIYIPFFKYEHLHVGVWFNSASGKKIMFRSVILSIIFTFVLIYLFEHFLLFDIWMNNWPSWIGTGLIPLLCYVVPVGAFLLFLQKRHQVNSTELKMSFTTILLSSYITMMLTALLLRQEGMLLIF